MCPASDAAFDVPRARMGVKDAADARKRIGAFIDTFYNQQRLHSALDYLTPEEYEQKHSRRREMEKAA